MDLSVVPPPPSKGWRKGQHFPSYPPRWIIEKRRVRGLLLGFKSFVGVFYGAADRIISEFH